MTKPIGQDSSCGDVITIAKSTGQTDQIRGLQEARRFDEPIEAPARDSQSVREAAQRLYGSLEKLVRRFPDQWVGWTKLKSQMEKESGADQPDVARPLV